MSDYIPDEDEPNVPYFFYDEDADGKRVLMRRLNGVTAPGTLRIADLFQDTTFVPDADHKGDYSVGD